MTRLFKHESPDGDKNIDFTEFLNPNSLHIKTGYLEPSLATVKKGERFQFQRIGYFNVDDDSTPKQIVFNKTVGLRDSWAKQKPKAANNNQNKTLSNNSIQPKAINLIQKIRKKIHQFTSRKTRKGKIRD